MTQVHSDLGGSGAERWMNCSGSVVLIRKLMASSSLPPETEADFRIEGSAAHEAAAHCLLNGIDTWEIVGRKFLDVEIDIDAADAVQVYLDYVRPLMIETNTIMIEKPIGERFAQRPHKDFFGRVDFAAYGPEVLTVVDYKHGAGIAVDAEENAQMMYYAFGILLARPKVRSDRIVRLVIVQPRAFHPDGPIREWETTAGEIINWAETELIPAMQRAEIEETFNAGSHCRFCPARAVCPVLGALYRAAVTANCAAVPNLTVERLALEFEQSETVKIYLKAIKDELQRRLMGGETDGLVKLVKQRSIRVFKPEAREKFKAKFGDEAFTKPELKSPAEMEKLGADAKELVKQLAYQPDTGLTVALASDKRGAIKVAKAAEVFASFNKPTE